MDAGGDPVAPGLPTVPGMVRPLGGAADDGGRAGRRVSRRRRRRSVAAGFAALVLAGSGVTSTATAGELAAAAASASVRLATSPAAAAGAAAVPAEPDVGGDDGADRYVGTGSVLLPGSFGSGERASAASCEGCRWRLTTTCLRDIDGGCSGTVGLCPPGEEHLRFWLSRPGSGWVRLGAGCIGPGGPMPMDRVAEVVADRFVRDLPAVDPAAQPSRGAVARIPVVFRSGQPRRWPARTYDLLGSAVTVRAQPLWTWRFDDGASLRTRSPGARWPDADVSHAYGEAGAYEVDVTTRWTATFTVDGLGPFDVEQPVSQDGRLLVRVGEGRAVLVG